ncbi:addiction module antitoxin [Scytonema hofmannii PCC 7110]|uniref:Addiction module antitoxin n=1 Tax=Scytonema hofmannii PCC 7110 TaxID=128403 RepID=A0A139X7Y1_9CYAN|nr:type II toxin-antitoxin system RelE/ParE family toxin [Scytonema hofmannii]KYC40804.1 addiction module antitoxin [Scytonema hofmannii PCC 7110]
MTESSPIEIRLTVEFQRKVRTLSKKYRQIQRDLEEILEQLQAGNFLGDRLSSIGYEIFKVRVKNRVIKKGKSAGYRLIYWIRSSNTIVLLDISSKSEQKDIEVTEIQRILVEFEKQSNAEQTEE